MKSGKNRLSCSLSAAVVAMLAGSTAEVLAQSAGAPATYSLAGVVRDFSPTSPDFGPAAVTGMPYSAGNIGTSLNNGQPAYIGGGSQIVAQATDILGRPIAPGAAVVAPLYSFTITDGKVTSAQPMAVRLRVIGAAIANGTQHVGVTMRVRNGLQVVSPFGSFDAAVSADVNDSHNPRSLVLNTLVKPGDALTVDARSWTLSNTSKPALDSSWSQYMTVFSTNGGKQVKALRNGDTVPNVTGFAGQVSAKGMLLPYLDATKTKVKLENYQVIFLFELGATDTSASAFDLQDLVVLADLANDPAAFSSVAPPPPTCGAVADAPATLGAKSAGGITSNDSFSHWFQSAPNENTSKRLDIPLTRGSDGVYSYSTPDFHPIDGDLYGNNGLPHNRGLTFSVDANVSYSKCTGQFFEYGGDLEAWVFVNGKLVLDMGGSPGGAKQIVDFDRLGLTDKSTARVQIFFAQRSLVAAAFHVRTNMLMSTPTMSVPSVSYPVD